MALILALQVLFAVATALASQDLVPESCLQGPDFWCQDMATAVQCQREKYCSNLAGDFLLWDQLEDEAAPSKKCTICTKVMEKLKSMLGDDPDEDDIEKALNSVCKALGRSLGRVCKSLVKKYKDQISDALQNNQEAGDICTQIKMCREPPEIQH
ncbi:saposin-C-like [Emydura macquarii macquarii]|uniref:saposin-C-like n=1 Tax=Emydura macquarii macquarii TaxID=1129001 RepID=UPI00352AEC65